MSPPSYPQRHRVRDRVADVDAHPPTSSTHGDKVFSIPRAYYDQEGERHTVGSINHVLPTPSRRKREPTVSTERLVVPGSLPPPSEEQSRVTSYFQFLNEQEYEHTIDLHDDLRETRTSRVATRSVELPFARDEMDNAPLARRCMAALASCALLAVGVAIATDGTYVVVDHYEMNNPWNHSSLSDVGVAYGTVETGVLIALAAFVSIVAVIARSEGVFFSHVLVSIIALVRAVDVLIAQSHNVVNTSVTDWTRVVLIVAATLFTLVLITITLYFAFDAVLYSRDEHVLRARGLVIAGAVLALVLVAGLLASTSLVAFVNAYNDDDQVILPLSLHHVILSALILLWAITVLGGGVSESRGLLLACAALYVPLAYSMTTSYGASLQLGWRVFSDSAVSDTWYYYVMLASGLLVNVYCVCILPLICHASL